MVRADPLHFLRQDLPALSVQVLLHHLQAPAAAVLQVVADGPEVEVEVEVEARARTQVLVDRDVLIVVDVLNEEML